MPLYFILANNLFFMSIKQIQTLKLLVNLSINTSNTEVLHEKEVLYMFPQKYIVVLLFILYILLLCKLANTITWCCRSDKDPYCTCCRSLHFNLLVLFFCHLVIKSSQSFHHTRCSPRPVLEEHNIFSKYPQPSTKTTRHYIETFHGMSKNAF